MSFIYTDLVKYYIVLWTGDRSWFPWITIVLSGTSFSFSVVYLITAISKKKVEVLNLVLSLPILVILIYWLFIWVKIFG
jgi:hypothetical protein